MYIYLAGQTNFGNRGCEALVRSSVGIIKTELPDTTIYCPLDNLEQDAQHWPDAKKYGVDYISSPVFSPYIRWWARINRILPLEKIGIPKFNLDPKTTSHLDNISALIMTGGDNITLDYGVMALYQWCSMVEKSIEKGVPAILWAASVGPFNEKPGVEKVMAKHLRRYSAITVRESFSYEYLKSIGVNNVELVADPAFCLEPESCEFSDAVRKIDNKILGLNVSPLIKKFRKNGESADVIDREIVAFIKEVISKTNLSIILISHVDNYDTQIHNSDWHYLSNINSSLNGYSNRVKLAPKNLNAAQVKDLIGSCNYFIGARTHSTIAALSQCVPTISIAYSVKAKGLNKDLFGHQNYVINTPAVNSISLFESLKKLQFEEENIRKTLEDRLPKWRQRAKNSALVLKKCLTDQQLNVE
jgi:polysaccharide pyruvyl transferase WcaK-like protein